ncbi:MAG TPA: bifunctional hydroxymethylpyrimidine kinase/phosphomethylpyrimidine kinase [Polyangia bacterium]|jgi:hydroxymethylpyrimidine/phosphomethylpyrimidine kinase|nr:bifunctional hydroxymethylpyrimidine kinase/phosphomethylpyrimidine kinase [Polyangia bacterium]
MDPERPVLVIAVAGVDQSGGAGLVRDVLTGAALGAGVACVGTAWTEQEASSDGVGIIGSTGVLSVEPRAPAQLGAALRRALARHPNAAVKIGMVPDAAAAAAIVGALDAAGFAGPLVVDPVLTASAGGALWSGSLDGLWPLLRRATLVTPNAGETARLSGKPVAAPADAEAAGRALLARGIVAVLIKGGHLGETRDTVTDRLVDESGVRKFTRLRVPGPSPRGTGCALSTAIAAALAGGATLPAAVDRAGRWLAGRIAAGVVVGGQRFLP